MQVGARVAELLASTGLASTITNKRSPVRGLTCPTVTCPGGVAKVENRKR